jgi:hypothetical protein
MHMQLHLVTKEIWNVAMKLYPYLPVWLIDKLVLLMCAVVFGDTAKHGLRRPAIGPFTMKCTTPVYPVIDIGTYGKIRSGEIRVLPAAVNSVRGNVVGFADGKQYPFDVIVFATGYRSTVRRWLEVRRHDHQLLLGKSFSCHIYADMHEDHEPRQTLRRSKAQTGRSHLSHACSSCTFPRAIFC